MLAKETIREIMDEGLRTKAEHLEAFSKTLKKMEAGIKTLSDEQWAELEEQSAKEFKAWKQA